MQQQTRKALAIAGSLAFCASAGLSAAFARRQQSPQQQQPANPAGQNNQNATNATNATGTMTQGQNQGQNMMAAEMAGVDQEFVTRAAFGNFAEIQTGQLAQQKGQNPDVQRLGQMLVQEHGQANDDLRQIAQRLNLTFPSDTDPIHKAMAGMLAGLNGSEFDRRFVDGQIKDHITTIALFEREAMLGSDPTLKAYARRYLRAIRGHTGEIQRVAGRVGVPPVNFSSYPLSPQSPMNMTGTMGSGGTGNGASGAGASGSSSGGAAMSGTTGTGGGQTMPATPTAPSSAP